jgi:transcription antitermination factor NusG
MATAYTPGLKVTSHLRHRVRRILPISGEVKVKVGEKVDCRDIVAETWMPGDATPINMANKLSVPPGDVAELMKKSDGDQISKDEVIAETKGIFGFFKSEYKSPVTGTIESISKVTGQMIVRGKPLPVQVMAYLTGEVVEVIENEGVVLEADVSFVQGIFGIGGEAFGKLRMACETPADPLTVDRIKPDMQGQIIVGGGRMTGDAVRRAIEIGAVAIVSAGMDDQDLRDILGFDLGVAITGSEKIGTTLIITEGFGDIAMAQRTFELLKANVGHDAAVNGATQIRAGVMRPEIVIPLRDEDPAAHAPEVAMDGLLQVGTSVRVIRDPYFGQLGKVNSLPTEPQALGSESRARVLTVNVESGEVITVPRANVELIEG